MVGRDGISLAYRRPEEPDGPQCRVGTEGRPEWLKPVYPEQLPLDQIFDVLRNERRRLALKYLLERDEQVTLSDLAENIASHEVGKPVEQLSSSERKCAYVGLYQCHLPKMAEMDIIEFNKPRGTIELGERAATLGYYLHLMKNPGRKAWPRYFVAVSIVGAVAFLVTASLGVGVFGVHAVFGVVLGLYAACTAAFVWEARNSKPPSESAVRAQS
jgi:hypothetical protein